jgi:hypothetical protein
MAIAYLIYPGYLDHGEPSVALISYRLLDGAPAYPAIDGLNGIANLYGPATYVMHALAFALLGPTVAAGKAASVAAAVFIPAAVFLSQRRRGLEAAAIAAALVAGLMLLHLPTSVWDRPDTFLALCAAVAVWIAHAADRSRAEWGKTAAIAICGGLAVGLKIHGGIYVAPVVVLHCLNPNRGFRAFAAICAIGAAVALLPFACPSFSLGNYLSWIAPMIGKPSPTDHVLRMLRYGAIYAVPLAFLIAGWLGRKPGAAATDDASRSADLGYAGMYAASLAAAVYLGAKPGAGVHYFYPLAAVTADLMLRFAPRLTRGEMARSGVMIVCVLAVLGLSVPVQKRFQRALHWQDVAAVMEEIRTVMDRYPGRTIEMGVGQDIRTYPRTFYKTLLVLAGNPYTIDGAVIIEWSGRNIPISEVTLAMVRGCSTELWLIPKGERPFAMVGYYGNPVFEPAFIDAFMSRYAKEKSFEYFDVWTCRH